MHHLFKLTALFVLFYSGQIFAQNISYGLELDPSYHLRENGEFNFSGGGFIALDLSDRFILSTGIKVGWQHLSDIDYSLVFVCDLDNIKGFNKTNSYIKIRQNATYLGLPLQARYKLSDKDNHFYVNYNFTYWFRLGRNAHETLVQCGTTTIDQRSFQAIHGSYGISNTFGFGYEFSFKEICSVYIEPRFGVSFYKLDGFSLPIALSEIKYNSRQNDLGLSVGLRFK